jgi:DNA polymerase-3 subunit alpha
MKKMLTRFRPGSIEDIILLVAAFRPGPLQYLDEIISAKHGRTKPRYIVPAMKDILSETYGRPVYQEQIMMVAHKIAGFTMGEADIIRAAISKKNLHELVKYKEKFIDGLIAAGAAESAANGFWTEMLDFGRYAFNKSHACAYAHLAYYTAWLKLHYPTEFMVSTLNYTPADKLPMMLRDCGTFGQTILPPDVNASGYGFTGAHNKIRIGLSNIKNVKEAANTLLAERENGRFESFSSLLTRAPVKINEIESMIAGGAMDGWGYSRSALFYVLPFFLDDLKVIAKKRQIIKELTASDSPGLTEKERKSLNTRLTNAGKKLEEYEYRFSQMEIPADMMDDQLEKLSRERELLGMYLSGNPLQSYPKAKKLRTRFVAHVAANETVTLCGMISDVMVKGRKSDGALMAFFTLSDETGDIGVSCFTKAYSQFGGVITNNAAVAITGQGYNDTAYDEEEAEIKLAVEGVNLLPHDKSTLVITVADMRDWTENIYPALRYFENADGFPLRLFDQSANRFRDTGLRLAEDALYQTTGGMEIQMET